MSDKTPAEAILKVSLGWARRGGLNEMAAAAQRGLDAVAAGDDWAIATALIEVGYEAAWPRARSRAVNRRRGVPPNGTLRSAGSWLS